MELGERITALRKKAGLSLDELAVISGVPRTTLGKISAGVTKAPALETIKAIVHAMGNTLDDLDDTPQKTIFIKPILSQEAQEVAEAYENADPKDRLIVRVALSLPIETGKKK